MPTVIGLILVAGLAGAGVWDVIAVLHTPPRETVSAVLQGWARQSPPAAVAVGVLIGHLFWPALPGGPRG